MNGAHDLGGMQNFGPVVAEHDEPVFHADWERRVFAMGIAMGSWRRWNIDMSRWAVERLPPVEYLSTSYYEHWFNCLLQLLEQSGLIDAEALRRVREAPESVSVPRPPIPINDGALRREQVARLALGSWRGTRLDETAAARFTVGQDVVTRNFHPIGHTRSPRYARGRRGIIHRDHGAFTFPDTNSRGDGPCPQHVYSVMFEARELWGPHAVVRDRVYIDLWDDYLDPA
jgi:nitrile hydratase subunit beta